MTGTQYADLALEGFHAVVDVLVLLESAGRREVLPAFRTCITSGRRGRGGVGRGGSMDRLEVFVEEGWIGEHPLAVVTTTGAWSTGVALQMEDTKL